MGRLFWCSFWIAVVAIGFWAYFRINKVPVSETVDGYVHPDFEPVRDKFRELLKDGWILGSQYAVYYNGELVVDLAGGYADEVARRPLKCDNYVATFSSIKSIFALLLAIVVDQSGVNFQDRVSKYWPEFAQNGKQDVTIANLLMHQAGVSGLDRTFSLQDAETNSEKYQRILEQQQPLTPINERPYYHAWTYGLYLDQLMRKIDRKGRGARQILADELAAKCGGLDIRLGLPPSEFYRLARYYQMSLRTLLDNDGQWGLGRMIGMWLNAPWEPVVQSNNGTGGRISWKQFGSFLEDWDHFEQVGDPAVVSKFAFACASGVATARDLAKAYYTVANGGFCFNKNKEGQKAEKVAVLSQATAQKLTQVLYDGPSGFLPMDEPRSLFGWVLQSPTNTSIFGSPGLGGQHGFADPEMDLAYAYFTNFNKPVMLSDHAVLQLRQATYQLVAAIRNRGH